MSKNNNIKRLGLFVAMLAMAYGVCAQHSETTVYVNGVLPVGQFSSKIDSPIPVPFDRQHIVKGATMGVGGSLGWGYKIDIMYGLLEPTVEVGFNWNCSNKDIRTSFEDAVVNDERPKAPNYYNVPALIGFKYIFDITKVIKPFVHAGIGVDFLFIGNNGYRDSSPLYRYKATGAFCWQAGVGTYITDHISITVQYESMGQHLIDYTSKSDKPLIDDGIPTERRNVNCMNFRLGLHF